jgi:hypothetical protein
MKIPELYTEVNNIRLFTFFGSCHRKWAGEIIVGRAGEFGNRNMYNLVLKLFGWMEARFKNNIQINVTDIWCRGFFFLIVCSAFIFSFQTSVTEFIQF